MKLTIPKTIAWTGRDVIIIDQTLLPVTERKLRIRTIEEMAEAIRMLRIRGAPAIGVAAAFGVVLGLRGLKIRDLHRRFERSCAIIRATRPTAVNLFWAVEKIRNRFNELAGTVTEPELIRRLFSAADHILQDDIARCRRLGDYGAGLLSSGDIVLTHCNAGAMATAGIGTALAVIYRAVEQGKKIKVYADETRPLLQGSRITAWELRQAGIEVTVITDNMAGWVMRKKGVTKVIVGADRIAANGDAANKIGTYGVAILAREHRIPFYVAAPISTIDIAIASGKNIPIEERHRNEVIARFGTYTAPATVAVFNPAFDVTDNRYISAIITDRGIARKPFRSSIAKLLRKDHCHAEC